MTDVIEHSNPLGQLAAYRELIAQQAERERIASIIDRDRECRAQMVEQKLGLLCSGGVVPVGGESAKSVRNVRRRRRAARQAAVAGHNAGNQQVLQGLYTGLGINQSGFKRGGHPVVPLGGFADDAEATAAPIPTHRLSGDAK